jgi:hypothetical protein
MRCVPPLNDAEIQDDTHRDFKAELQRCKTPSMSYDGIFRIDRRHDRGPFDIIGDVHGCAEELQSLLTALGYRVAWSDGGKAVAVTPPAGRKAIFAGDLFQRESRSVLET